MSTNLHSDPAAIEAALQKVIETGSVFEIRALGVQQSYGAPCTMSGYFTSETIAEAAKAIERTVGDRAQGTYFTVNPVVSDLLARRANRISRCGKGEPTTGNHEIQRRRWLPLDFDPVRPTGISATEEEHKAALELAEHVRGKLKEAGWSDPVFGDSGNGAYLLYPVDLPADDGGLVERATKALAARFSTPEVKIDQAVHNPARIWRVPGTVNRKGDNTPERPHRMARIIECPPTREVVPTEMIEKLASTAPSGGSTVVLAGAVPPVHGMAGWSREQVEQLLANHLADNGVGAAAPFQDGAKWPLGKCPFDDTHTGGSAAVFWTPLHGPGFKCHHDSCKDHHWRELLSKFNVDGRAATSPANGQSGGRPPTTKLIADGFIQSEGTPFPIKRHQGQWFRYDGRLYRPMTNDDLKGRVMAFLRKIHPGHATKNMVVNVAEHLLAADVGGVESHHARPCWLPSGVSAAGWITMRNGIVNVDALARRINGEAGPEGDVVRPHTEELFSTFGLPYEYDPTAKCPQWMEYLAGVQPDPAMRELLQMLAGLALVPDTTYEVFFVFYGDGGCGKTVFLFVLENLVGPSNVCTLPLNKFAEKHSTHLLCEHLLNIVGDLPTSDGRTSLHAIEGVLKDVASGGLLACERKNQEPFQAHAVARCIFAANSLPTFADRSSGIWDRMRIVPFDVRFRGTDKQNPHLAQDIVATELPGIFNWAVRGLAKLRTLRQFPRGPRGEELEAQHRRDCDHERQYFSEHCEVIAGAFTETQNLYGAYKFWAENSGYRPKNVANFTRELRRVFPEAVEERRRTDGRRLRGFLNLRMVNEPGSLI